MTFIRFVILALLALVGLLPGASITQAAPAPDPVGPDGVTRIVVEAEDMKGVDSGGFGMNSPKWQVGRAGFDLYQNNVFGGHWQSRTRTVMTDAGDNAAELKATVNVPKAGKYKVWVKYECPPYFNYAFDVEVAAGGKSLLRKTYGLIDSPKHFCFTDKLTTGNLYWSWGIDHDAAEGYVVELPAGEVNLTIAKTKNPAPAGARSIDVVMITSDLSDLSAPRYPRYPLLDELMLGNSVYFRYKLDAKAAGPAKITWSTLTKRYPAFYAPYNNHQALIRFYDDKGQVIKNDKGEPLSEPSGQLSTVLKPGESGPWMNVGPIMTVESATTVTLRATPVDDKGVPVRGEEPSLPMSVEIGTAPADVVKTLTMASDESALSFLLQPDLKSPEGKRWTIKLTDVYRHMVEELDKLPRIGPIPGKMRFFGGTGTPYSYAPVAGQANLDLSLAFRLAVGLNTLTGNSLDKATVDAHRTAYAKAKAPFLGGGTIQHGQDPEAAAKSITAGGDPKAFYFLSFGDEIGLPAVDINDPKLLAEFHEFLKKRNVSPADLGLASWDVVKPLNAMSNDVAVQIGVLPKGQSGAAVDKTLKRLYWHSAGFRVHKGVEDFAAKTRKLKELLGPDAHTSANLGGMHPFYWMHQSSFIESFKGNAMSVAWSEDYDYCQPETSRLVIDWQAGYLKAGTKYNGQRMQFYCMPHYPGNSPEHLLQNAVTLFGQNIKDIDWFSIPPDGFSTENYVSVRDGLPTFKVMRDVSGMAGKTEDWLDPAKPIQAPIAFLLSEASDTWELGGEGQGAVAPGSVATNAFQEERKNTYYVLRNAGYRVDLVTEADVQEGRLKGYQFLYVGGENMEKATVKPISEWVKAGGIVYASAGAARKDEYDEPLTGLDPVLGRGAATAYERFKGPLRSKLELLFCKPIDSVHSRGGEQSETWSFDAIVTLERFKAGEGATVLATYKDDSPAFVSAKTGKGAGYYIGASPGEAWAKKALPVRPTGKGGQETSPAHFEPVIFDIAAGEAILRPLVDAKMVSDTRVTQQHIVTNRLQSPKGTVITVVNLGHQQLGKAKGVQLQIEGMAKPKKVWSTAYPKGLDFKELPMPIGPGSPPVRPLSPDLKQGVPTIVVELPEVGLVDIVVLEAP
ncbi:MAG: beta-galactosidase trimerization domain-containing protein [Planctomycetota bacterium]|nr:beta-galactosidase trimerization domain-containing protein [Planctomycetota bacterium]